MPCGKVKARRGEGIGRNEGLGGRSGDICDEGGLEKQDIMGSDSGFIRGAVVGGVWSFDEGVS